MCESKYTEQRERERKRERERERERVVGRGGEKERIYSTCVSWSSLVHRGRHRDASVS